jgi:hypothetical protein
MKFTKRHLSLGEPSPRSRRAAAPDDVCTGHEQISGRTPAEDASHGASAGLPTGIARQGTRS